MYIFVLFLLNYIQCSLNPLEIVKNAEHTQNTQSCSSIMTSTLGCGRKGTKREFCIQMNPKIVESQTQTIQSIENLAQKIEQLDSIFKEINLKSSIHKTEVENKKQFQKIFRKELNENIQNSYQKKNNKIYKKGDDNDFQSRIKKKKIDFEQTNNDQEIVLQEKFDYYFENKDCTNDKETNLLLNKIKKFIDYIKRFIFDLSDKSDLGEIKKSKDEIESFIFYYISSIQTENDEHNKICDAYYKVLDALDCIMIYLNKIRDSCDRSNICLGHVFEELDKIKKAIESIR